MWFDNIVDLIFYLVALGIIAFLAIRIYRKQEVKLSKWKVIVVIIVGVFSFSIHFPMFEKTVELAILPLGVWILYFLLRNKGNSWKNYRPYALLGFAGNYIFLAAFFISIFIYHLIYDENELSHYISDISEAEIIPVHPDGEGNPQLRGDFMETISKMKQKEFFSVVSYDDMFMVDDFQKENEHFPYLLANNKPRWGSGADAVIYIEKDGKGILVNTEKRSVYFRSNEKVLKEKDL